MNTLSYGIELTPQHNRLHVDVPYDIFESLHSHELAALPLGSLATKRAGVIAFSSLESSRRLYINTKKIGNGTLKFRHDAICGVIDVLNAIDVVTPAERKDARLSIWMGDDLSALDDERGMAATVAWPDVEDLELSHLTTVHMLDTATKLRYPHSADLYATVSRQDGVFLTADPGGEHCLETDILDYDPDASKFQLCERNLNGLQKIICFSGVVALAGAKDILRASSVGRS